MHPPPPEPSPEQAAAADKAAAASAGKASKGKGGKAGAEAPAATVEFVQDMRQAVQHYADSWQDWQEGDPAGALLPPELQGLPTPRGGTGAERCDIELIKAEVRAWAWGIRHARAWDVLGWWGMPGLSLCWPDAVVNFRLGCLLSAVAAAVPRCVRWRMRSCGWRRMSTCGG